MSESRSLFASYLRQQRELGMPDYILSAPMPLFNTQKKTAIPVASYPKAIPQYTQPKPQLKPAPVQATEKKGPGLLSAMHLHQTIKVADPVLADPKRDAMLALYHATKDCKACALGNSRNTYVFGSGNPAAKLLIIGEAPGADEDAQGKPFVGKAGELLTKMLAAINLDRKNQTFIANILKCRPPENRNPEVTEIIACKHILLSQIDIVKPAAILLLGRIAAHTLLDSQDSIAALRTKNHSLCGVPAFVTYHPAALLRNPEYKRPTWEDLQKLQRLLLELGIYADSSK